MQNFPRRRQDIIYYGSKALIPRIFGTEGGGRKVIFIITILVYSVAQIGSYNSLF